jgi:hypothetical protein
MIPIKTEAKKKKEKKSTPYHPATPHYGTSEAEAGTLRVTRIARLLRLVPFVVARFGSKVVEQLQGIRAEDGRQRAICDRARMGTERRCVS